MNRRHVFFFIFLCVLSFTVIFQAPMPACAEARREVGLSKGRTLDLTVNRGERFQLKLSNAPKKGRTKWIFSEKGVLRAEKRGRKGAALKALSYGTVTVVAKNGKKQWKCRVAVQEEAEGFEDFSAGLMELLASHKNQTSYAGQGGIASSEGSEYLSARLLVKSSDKDAQFVKYEPEAVLKSEDNIYVLQFDTAARAKKALGDLEGRQDVIWAEPDFLVGTGTVQGSGGSETEPLSWGVERMGADQLAPTLSGSITVAVVDIFPLVILNDTPLYAILALLVPAVL